MTFPTRWTGKVYFNLSIASPVNVLSSSELYFEECGWELDYPIGMPEGVSWSLRVVRRALADYIPGQHPLDPARITGRKTKHIGLWLVHL